jgi:hypothetical protein
LESIEKKMYFAERIPIWQLQQCMNQTNMPSQLSPESTIMIDSTFPDQVVASSRLALKNLRLQKDIYDFPGNEGDINLKAIRFIKLHGCIIDIDVLKPLIDNPLYGHKAVQAIKKLSS